MRTNQSKHTVCFHDHSWPEDTPTYPSAAQVYEYLHSYAKRYIPWDLFSFKSKVIRVSRSNDSRWQVTWATFGHEQTSVFDFLILASGFFSEPYIPDIPGHETFPGKTIHSGAYTDPEMFKDANVAIVGGSLSGVEVAEDIGPYAASVHHVITRAFWILPKFLPVDPENPSSPFLPLDTVLYRRMKPPSSPGAKEPTVQERWRMFNEKLDAHIGPTNLPKDLQVKLDGPVYATVSDMYTHYVTSGHISLHKGHLSSISGTQLTLDLESSPPLLDNITHIIFATGFRPSSATQILDPSILSELNFSPKEFFLPYTLYQSTLHPALPNAAFVGNHRGPFWGIIELQAMWAAGLFSGALPWPSVQEMQVGIEQEKTLRDSRPRPQWPRGDYAGFGTELANAIGLKFPPASEELSKFSVPPNEVFSPALFSRPSWLQRREIVEQTGVVSPEISLQGVLHQSVTAARFVAAAIFRALHGKWQIQREYASRLPEYPSGPSTGSAEFRPRIASILSDEEGNGYKVEYLYSEQTVLTTATGLQLRGSREYVYRYHEPKDKLAVYFVKRDESFTVDYLFHRIDLEIPEKSEEKRPWKARSSHFCDPDNYEVSYEFYFKGTELEKWNVSYTVKGPKKDYYMSTWYTR